MGKLINFSLYALLFLLFCFLPSIVITGLKDATQTSKFILFSYLCCPVLILYLIKSIVERPVFTVTVPDVLLLILVGFIIINRCYLHSMVNFSVRYNELLGLIVIYMVLRRMPPKVYFILLSGLMAGGILQAVHGCFQLYGFLPSYNPNFAITGSFSNPGPYAGYLASVSPAAVAAYFSKTNPITASITNWHICSRARPFRYLYTILGGIVNYVPVTAAALIILVIIPTQSRAAWISLLTVILLAVGRLSPHFTHFIKTYFSSGKKRVTAIAVSILLVLAGTTATYNLKKDSANGRVLIWKVTAKMIADNPLKGTGLDQFKTVYMNYQANYLKKGANKQDIDLADDVNYAFNEPLQFIAENGVIAGIAAAILLFVLFNSGSDEEPLLSFTAKAGLASVLVFSLFSYPSQILPIKLNATLYLAYLAKTGKPLVFYGKKKHGLKPITTVLMCGLFATTLIATYFVNITLSKLYDAFCAWNTADIMYETNDYRETIKYCEQAYEYFNNDGVFMFKYGKALEMCKESKKSIPILKKAQELYDTVPTEIALGNCYSASQNYIMAEKAYLKASAMTPAKFYPQYLLAKVYNQSGEHEKAVAIARALIQKKIKITSDAANDIVEEMRTIVNNRSAVCR